MFERMILMLVSLLFCMLCGCGAPAQCAPEDMIDGVCAGVPPDPICESDDCSGGMECTTTMKVGSDAELSDALAAGVSPGACIVLGHGAYGPLVLPAGVKLLGSSAELVKVEALTFDPGQGAAVRGVTVAPGGVVVSSGVDARLDSVRVSGGQDAAVLVEAGASLSIERSEATASDHHGILVEPGGSVTLHASVVADNAGPGLTATCDAAVCCAQPPPMDVSVVQIDHTIFRQNRVLGVALAGAQVTIEHARVIDTDVGDTWLYGQGGGGVQISSCADVTARSLEVRDNVWVGILVDRSTASLGADDEPGGVQISHNEIGLWVQGISQPLPQSVTIAGADIYANSGVGVGFDEDSRGIIFCKSHVSNTMMRTMWTLDNTQKDVGDGVVWLGGSGVQMDSIQVMDSARVAVLIDGPVAAGSKMSNTTASGGQPAIVHQDLPDGGQAPVFTQVSPAPQTSQSRILEVVQAPVLTSGL